MSIETANFNSRSSINKIGGFKVEIESLRAENKSLRDDISQLRLKKSGEIVKLKVEDKNIEDDVSKEVSNSYKRGSSKSNKRKSKK